MKDFIFFGGIGWCGTSSLWYTLQHLQPYLFTGSRKETFYLRALDHYNLEGFLNLEKHIAENQLAYGTVKKSKGSVCSEYSTLSKSEIDPKKEQATYQAPPSLKTYIEYYLELSRASDKYFKCVADFSNANAFVSTNLIKEANKELSKHFNVKSIIMFRDPVRRLFSQIGSSYYHRKTLTYDKNLISNPVERYVKNFLNTKDLRNIPWIDYTKQIKEYRSVFGEALHLSIMEEFFKNPEDCMNNPSVIEMGRFLNYKIQKVYPCAFVPDKGINAPHIECLEDQYLSDGEPLTPEMYQFCFDKMKFIYEEFKDVYGYLPEGWGEPIDYGY